MTTNDVLICPRRSISGSVPAPVSAFNGKPEATAGVSRLVDRSGAWFYHVFALCRSSSPCGQIYRASTANLSQAGTVAS